MKPIYQFDNTFCDRLISIVDKSQCYSYEICRAENPDIEIIQPTNSLQFKIKESEESIIINNIVNSVIKNINSIQSVIQISDNAKKYIPHKYQNPYTIISVLNDTFEGGRISVDNTLIPTQRGECICLTPNNSFNVEPIISGERYSLVIYVDVLNKKEKSIL